MIDGLVYALLPVGLVANFGTIWTMNSHVFKDKTDAVHFNSFGFVHMLALVVATAQHWMLRMFTPVVQYTSACYVFDYLRALAMTLAVTIDLVNQLHVYRQIRRVRRDARQARFGRVYLGLLALALGVASVRWLVVSAEDDIVFDKDLDAELRASPLYTDCRHYDRISLVVFDLLDLAVLAFSSVARALLAYSTISVVSQLGSRSRTTMPASKRPARFVFLYSLCTLFAPVLNSPIVLLRLSRHTSADHAEQYDLTHLESLGVLLQHVYLLSPFLTQLVINIRFKKFLAESLCRSVKAKRPQQSDYNDMLFLQ